VALIFSRYWSHIVAVVAVLAIIGGIYWKGASDKEARLALASVQSDLLETQRLRALEQKTYQKDAKLAAQAQVRLSGLSAQIDGLNEYVATLEDAGRECLAPADTERLRNLWK